MTYSLDPAYYTDGRVMEPTRAGFGRGLLAAGHDNPAVVALCADLTESTQMHLFKEAFPERFVEIGVAEQNLATVASGMAHAGKIPFCSSYAAFSPGRNWEQIRTTIALNNQPVKVIGSHAGIYTGKDGATHQMLEDIALMRAMPNMVVIAPGDSREAEKATKAMAVSGKPAYMRLAREKTPVFSAEDAPFEIGKAYVLREGKDIALLGTGTMTSRLLDAAEALAKEGVDATVVHFPTIKPLDEKTLLAVAKKAGRIVTAEEAQIAGGFGSAVSEALTTHLPMPVLRLGVDDRFGESGNPEEIFELMGLSIPQMTQRIKEWAGVTHRYHQ